MRPIAVDLYGCQGGMGHGLQLAGFYVIGVDIEPQPRYRGDEFHCADAIAWLRVHREWIRKNVTLVHAAPPCQLDSDCQRIMQNEHPDLIGPTRDALEEIGLRYSIENVAGALPKLRDPVELCGLMFGMTRTYRHRYFEAGGWTLPQPAHPAHVAPQVKMGRAPKDGEVIQAVGNFSGVGKIRAEWGVPWMNRDGIREAVPPAYGEYVGRSFLAHLKEAAA